MTDLPAPLTPSDCDLRDFSYMPLEVNRLRDSELVSCVTPECAFAAVLIWCASWHQLPAASIPKGDDWVADIAGYKARGKIDSHWKKVRDGALHGFIECNDGRLYHPVVAEKALEAWIQKLLVRHKSGVGNLKRWQHPFDDEPQIIAALHESRSLLEALNPQSPILKKPIPKLSNNDPNGTQENTVVIPTGINKTSHRDSHGDFYPQEKNRNRPDQTRPDHDQTGPVINKNPVSAVIAPTWWPSSQTFQDLRMVHGYAAEWIEQQVPSFVAYWRDRNEPRTSFDALFIQHCQHCAKPRALP